MEKLCQDELEGLESIVVSEDEDKEEVETKPSSGENKVTEEAKPASEPEKVGLNS